MATLKKAFGVYQDGDELRIAAVTLDGDELVIDSLYKERFSADEQPADKAMADQFASPFADTMSGFDDTGDFDFGDDDKKDDVALEFEELDITESDTDVDIIPDNATMQDGTLTRAAMAMQMNTGLVCANMDVSNITYRRISLPEKTPEKKILGEVRKAFYTPEQQSLCAYSYFPSGDLNEIIGIRHEGSMELLENLVEVNQESFNSEFDFNLVQPNEVALMNAVRYNYEIFGDDVIAIFYIGVDFSRITLMQGERYLLELPIINEGYGSENILNTVYSRFLLEKAHHDIPPLNRIYLAGSGLSNDTVDVLREKEPDATIEYLLPKRLMETLVDGEDYTDEELAAFIIPIMLATASLMPKESLLLHSNFLPRQIRKQKTFALGYGGVGILAVVITVALIVLQGIMNKNAEIRHLKRDIQQLDQHIAINMSVIEQIRGMEMQIIEHENNLARVNALIGDRNQWHFILEEISDSFIDNYLSWSTNIHKEEGDQFRLKGSTTRRTNIVAFSLMFPFGRIEKVVEKEIEGYTVWDYEIVFGMPDPLETKKLDYKREGIDITPPTLEEEQQTKASAPEVVATQPEPAPEPEPEPQPTVAKPEPKPEPVAQQQTPPAQQQTSAKPAANQKPAAYDAALKTYFRGDLAKAEEMFEAFVAESSGSWVTNATYFLGEINYRQEEHQQAAEKFQRVLELGGRKQADALMMLGNTYEKLEQTQKAIEYWERLTTQYPRSRYIEMAERKINEASAE